LRDLQIEQAASREALRLAFEHHKSLAREMVGVQQQRDISDIFEQKASGSTLVNMFELDMLIGSGGVLAHAPKLAQTALMMMDAYAPQGLTTLAKDSIFMMPQLGILSTLLPEAATEVFEKDCLIRIADCLAPVGTAKAGEECFTALVDGKSYLVPFGEIVLVPVEAGRTVNVECRPGKSFDFGDGKGRSKTYTTVAGELGLVLDGRGRPIVIPVEDAERAATMRRWLEAMGLSRS
jgi:hypothetical protein